jgi:hypothetical protein
MRYRKLDANGDYSFGASAANFFINSPQAVAQAIETRLDLQLGEWFADTADGTPWLEDVLGKYTSGTYDSVLRARILETPGASQILAYSSALDEQNRSLTVHASVLTIYSTTPVSITASV